MVLIPDVDAAEQLGAWLANRRPLLEERQVTTSFRIGEVASERASKAAIEFRRGESIGCITMWANGMIDLDILRQGETEPQSTTRECMSLGEVPAMLDAYLFEFVGTV